MSVYTPTVHVEVAFGYSPMQDTTDGSFVDLSARSDLVVESCVVARGRPNEFEQFPPGTCQLQITDRNRVLDPQNSSGPYYGQLKPRVPIRVRAKVGGTYYPRFFGYVDGWPMQLGHRETIVNVTATDGFKVLNGARLSQSSLDALVLADEPVAYWRFGEDGTTAADSSPNHNDAVYPATASPGATIVPTGSNGSVEWDDGVNGAVVGPVGSVVQTLPITVEMWVESDAGAQSEDRILLWSAGGDEEFLFATGYAGTPGQVLYLNYLGSDAVAAGLTLWQRMIYDGIPHHIVLVIDSSTRELYIDGALVPKYSQTAGSVSSTTERATYVGGYSGFVHSFPGRMSNFAIYNTALSASDALNHYQAGSAIYGDNTGDRVEQVLDAADWPASLRVLDDGEMLLAPAMLEGQTALNYLRRIEASEQGRLFMTKDGKVAFHQRDRFTSVAVEGTTQYTFSDDGAGNSLHAFAGITYDDRFTYNEARVTREGGNTVTVVDETSQSSYGPLTRSLDSLLLLNDAQSRALGERIVYRYKDPQPRASTWAVQPEVDAANWPDLFALEIGYKIALETTPASRGSQLVMGLHIEQITDTIAPDSYEISFAGSAVDTNSALYFRFNGDGSTQGWGFGVWR